MAMFNDPGSLGKSEVPKPLFKGRILSVELTLLTVSPATNTISFSWYIVDDTCSSKHHDLLHDVESICPVVNIYLDMNSVADRGHSEKPASNNIPEKSIFDWNASAPLANGYFAQEPLFFTSIRTGARNDTRGRHGTMSYPWDEYLAGIWINGLEDNPDRKKVAIKVAYTQGVQFGFSTTIMPRIKLDSMEGAGSTKADIEWSMEGGTELFVLISRTWHVKAFVILIVGAMWTIDLLLLATTIRGVFFGYPIEAEVLVVPVSSLFAFTSLRSAMPGAPKDFGTVIDFVGTLPALTCLIITSALCLYHFARRGTHMGTNVGLRNIQWKSRKDIEAGTAFSGAYS
ncbi:hypothetical protein OF83DRAFT_1160372, partial [Amylostereum chailletii]